MSVGIGKYRNFFLLIPIPNLGYRSHSYLSQLDGALVLYDLNSGIYTRIVSCLLHTCSCSAILTRIRIVYSNNSGTYVYIRELLLQFWYVPELYANYHPAAG